MASSTADDLEQLDREIIDAHARNDRASLARLYIKAANRLLADDQRERAAFLFVNAYVWALDTGDELVASEARELLKQMGREQ